MMEVYRRKLALDKYNPILTAVTLFYFRNILKKLATESKSTFKKIQKSVKFSVKCDADIKLINIRIIAIWYHGHESITNNTTIHLDNVKREFFP